MKLISTLLLYLILAGLAAGCFKGVMSGGDGVVPTGFMGTGNPGTITLEDDVSNQLKWKTASGGTIIGNVLNPVINGACTGVTEVEIWVNGAMRKSVACLANRFQISLNGGSAFTNGVYSLEFKTIPSSVIIERTYDVLSVDPATLVTLGSVPASTIQNSIDVSLTCNSDLDLTIAGVTTDCDNTDAIVQAVALVLGTNSFTVTWVDRHNNSGSQSYSLTRNPAGTPEVSAGMISATASSVISLSNCSGACDGTTLSKVAIYGFQAGSAGQDIPVSRAPASGGGGETISIGNHSYIFCENQNPSGECIP